jgi:subtilisin family serine protease
VAKGAKVINLSLGDLSQGITGFAQSPAIATAIGAAVRAGSVVVVAAGDSWDHLPSRFGPGALVVAASGPSGSLASYSQRGGRVNLAAPGGDDGPEGFSSCSEKECVLSSFPYDSYGLLEGTSVAAAHVSGTAALLLAEDPGRDGSDAVQALESSAKPLRDAGSGTLDAAAALSGEVASDGKRTPDGASKAVPTMAGSTPGSSNIARDVRNGSRLPVIVPAASARSAGQTTARTAQIAGALAAVLLLVSATGTGLIARRAWPGPPGVDRTRVRGRSPRTDRGARRWSISSRA